MKRSRLSKIDRGFWVLLRRIWTDWESVLVIVKPETVVRWHRCGFRRYWTWKSRRRRPGRPGVAPEGTVNPNRKIFEARKRETAALGAGEKLVLGHPLAATLGDSARCMQNLEKVLFTGPKTSDTVTFICD